MRIALLTDGIFPYVIGGMQKHSYSLAKYLVKSGVHVDLYHTNFSDKDIEKLELFTEEEKKLIHSIVIPFPELARLPGHYLKSSYLYSQNILEEFKRRPEVDFVYIKGFSGWKLIEERAKGKLKLNSPVGVNFHGYEMFQLQPGFKSFLQSVFLLRKPLEYNIKNADCVFSYGGKISEIIKKIGIEKNKIIEIPTGIEPGWMVSEPKAVSGNRKFIFAGRYERRKGIEELTQVIKGMDNSLTFEFDFIGDIPELKKITSPKIKYHGTIRDASEIKKIISSCDVLVCPSYAEGMPNVIMEAMARGLAVIASDVGAVAEMVSGENGILIQTFR